MNPLVHAYSATPTQTHLIPDFTTTITKVAGTAWAGATSTTTHFWDLMLLQARDLPAATITTTTQLLLVRLMPALDLSATTTTAIPRP